MNRLANAISSPAEFKELAVIYVEPVCLKCRSPGEPIIQSVSVFIPGKPEIRIGLEEACMLVQPVTHELYTLGKLQMLCKVKSETDEKLMEILLLQFHCISHQ